MPQPSVEQLGDELGLDPEFLGYWTDQGVIPLGEYTWYGPNIAEVPSGGSRTDNTTPSSTTVIRLSMVNKDNIDNSATLRNLTIGGILKYGDESWVVNSFTTLAGAVDIYVSSHEGPDETFLAVAMSASVDADVSTLESSSILINIGFTPSEVEQPTVSPKPWTWTEVLDILTANGVDPSLEWSPLQLMGAATGDQDLSMFISVVDTMLWKGEISSAARDDLVALVERTEESIVLVPGPSRWEELWGIDTITNGLVSDARDYALANYTAPYSV